VIEVDLGSTSTKGGSFFPNADFSLRLTALVSLSHAPRDQPEANTADDRREPNALERDQDDPKEDQHRSGDYVEVHGGCSYARSRMLETDFACQ